MIPEFPEFKNLELSDKDEIENLTRQFPPYSDFHFVTIYCWDIDNNTLISRLNGNLIIKQIDCLTREQFFSFIGINSVPKTIEQISIHLNQNQLPLIFRWMPEVTVNCLNGLKATITEDRDYFDYIYNVSDFYHAKGSDYKIHRQNSTRFVRNYPKITTRLIDLPNSEVKNQINNLFKTWAENKKIANKECEPASEYKALKKLLSSASEFKDLITLGVFDQDEMIAFSISELPDKEYASLPFLKANTNYTDIFMYLLKETTKLYYKNGIKFMNFESDLGLEPLRVSKLRYRPAFFLKKYKIELSN